MESRDKAGHEEQRLHKDARAQCRGGTGQKSQGVQHVPFSFVSVSLLCVQMMVFCHGGLYHVVCLFTIVKHFVKLWQSN